MSRHASRRLAAIPPEKPADAEVKRAGEENTAAAPPPPSPLESPEATMEGAGPRVRFFWVAILVWAAAFAGLLIFEAVMSLVRR